MGTAVVFAAGNLNRSINDTLYHNGLAVHPDVIAVSSSTSLDQRSDTSNFGSEICICAASSSGGGWTLANTDVNETWIDTTGTVRPRGHSISDDHMHFGGTSSASPLFRVSVHWFSRPQLNLDLFASSTQRINLSYFAPHHEDGSHHQSGASQKGCRPCQCR